MSPAIVDSYERWRLAGHTCTPPTRGEVPGCPECERPGGYLDKVKAQRKAARERQARDRATGRFLESLGIRFALDEPPTADTLRRLVLSLPKDERGITLDAMDVCLRCGNDLTDPIVEECPCRTPKPVKKTAKRKITRKKR